MKKVIIMGASGSLAPFVINEIKDAELTLFVRNQNRLSSNISKQHNVIEGDAMNFDNVKNAINGHDIVYVNLAGNLEAMTKNIIKAMKETSVRRIIAISSIGIYDEPVKSILLPYRKLADVIESSGLDYTILRPNWFTNENKISYIITNKGQPETGTSISRKSIGSFVGSIIENPELYNNQNLGISKPQI